LVGRVTSLWHKEPFIASSLVDNSQLVTRFQFYNGVTYGFNTVILQSHSYYQVGRGLGVNDSCYSIMGFGPGTTKINLVQSSSYAGYPSIWNSSETFTNGGEDPLEINNLPSNVDGTEVLSTINYHASDFGKALAYAYQ
jgi:hypothetical protein